MAPDSAAEPADAPADERSRAAGHAAAGREAPENASASSPLLKAGRYAWALVGLAALLILAGLAAGRLMLVVVPLVIALFPAALLEPVARWLKRTGMPAALAALLTVLGAILVLVGVFGVLVPVFAAEVPELAESFREGVDDLLAQAPFDVGGMEELLDRARDQLGRAGEYVGGAVEAVTAVFEAVAGVLFGLVVLFFYLKDGGRIAAGIRDLLPARLQRDATEVGRRVWHTLGSYFRGQLLIALVDAVLIGLGLVALGIPLALPLAVLVFFGGLFPIVGAVVTGAVAVVVALAHGGLVTALIVLGLVVGVQQLESNVLEPVVLSKAIALHPLMVIVAITAGAVTLGVLGAFLAVPIAASVGRVVDYLQGRDRADGGGVEEDDEEEGDPEPAMASRA
ncbi:MAG TPA: AI-2E family transporter [Egibacteraceae bacterium]|nr:AI-2E family transporter [Egibacteraceae bacterium]